MQRLHKYYIFLKPQGGNVGLPRQARALLNIIQVQRTIEKRKLVKLIAFSNALKTKQAPARIITYYVGMLVQRGLVEVLITTRKLEDD